MVLLFGALNPNIGSMGYRVADLAAEGFWQNICKSKCEGDKEELERGNVGFFFGVSLIGYAKSICTTKNMLM